MNFRTILQRSDPNYKDDNGVNNVNNTNTIMQRETEDIICCLHSHTSYWTGHWHCVCLSVCVAQSNITSISSLIFYNETIDD